MICFILVYLSKHEEIYNQTSLATCILRLNSRFTLQPQAYKLSEGNANEIEKPAITILSRPGGEDKRVFNFHIDTLLAILVSGFQNLNIFLIYFLALCFALFLRLYWMQLTGLHALLIFFS